MTQTRIVPPRPRRAAPAEKGRVTGTAGAAGKGQADSPGRTASNGTRAGAGRTPGRTAATTPRTPPPAPPVAGVPPLDRSRVRRVWAQDVLVRADMVRAKLEAIRADNDLSPGTCKLADAVAQRLDAAQRAALKESPRPRRLSNWWRGTLVDAAYQNLHVAEVLMTSIYTDAQVRAEIPEAISRVDARLARSDPRRVAAFGLTNPRLSTAERRERLSKAVQVGFEAADFEHTRLRNFRNAVVGSTVVLAVAIVGIVVYAWFNPSAIPVCFQPDGVGGDRICATGVGEHARDLATIAAMGALGGLLAAIISIRNMQGTSIAYDVPTALAALKLPVGALAALGGLLLIRANFVPGLTALDSREQILAYAFIFGVAQQLVVGLIDKHAQELLASAPGKGGSAPGQPPHAGAAASPGG